ALLADDARVEVRGVLGAAHRAGAAGAGSPRLPLEASSIGGFPGCTGEVRVRMPPGEPDLPPGSVLTVTGRWREYIPAEGSSPWPADPRYHGFVIADSVIVDANSAADSPFWLR